MLITLTVVISFTYGWIAAVTTANYLDKRAQAKRERDYQLEWRTNSEDLVPIPNIIAN